ncbi:MAG: DNA-3-methyladenine glycosylase 2 family protein, partial [Planctomycetes bacterium]|nr:DNA-3-methyladenine glycosylase 2 family protein [Planctomycetota bacterium]
MKMIPYAEKARRHLAAADPSMAALVGRVGACRLETHECAPYESLVRAIVYQQLSGKAAATIFGRLRAACRDDVAPKRLAALSDAALRAAGISPQKLGYLRNLTEHSAAGRLDFRNIHNNSDEEIIDSLV